MSNETAGKTEWQHAEDGFVCSLEEIDRFIARAERFLSTLIRVDPRPIGFSLRYAHKTAQSCTDPQNAFPQTPVAPCRVGPRPAPFPQAFSSGVAPRSKTCTNPHTRFTKSQYTGSRRRRWRIDYGYKHFR